jgi:hypothetical protein
MSITIRQKTDEEVPCPVCGHKIKPKCPFYAFCHYRLGGLGIVSICVSQPEMCTFFKTQGGVSKMNIKINPSRRDELDYEPI